MRTCYTLIFFALIVLFSNSSLAYRIYQYPYEQYQVNVPLVKLMMAVPSEDGIAWPQNVLVPVNQISNTLGRIRRGWGSGRRRRRSIDNDG